MRSADYSNLEETYGTINEITKPQMVRLALVTGMFPQFEEREKYRELVKLFCDFEKKERIDILYDLLTKARTERQKEYLDDLLKQVHFKHGIWRRLDYQHLTDEGVIIQHNGSISDLEKGLIHIKENKVLSTNIEIDKKGVDYLKDVKPKNMLVLNSKDVIVNFAERKGFKLPEKYLENGRLTETVYKSLEEYKFTFIEAVKSTVEIMKTQKYIDRQISVFVIKRRNGDQVRIFPYSIDAGTELHYESYHYRPEEFDVRQGKLDDGSFKLYTTNIFRVSKREPLHDRKYNEVTTHYLPHDSKERDMTLEWLSTMMNCNCDWDLNTRNFEIRIRRMTRTASTQDPHARDIILTIAESARLTEEDKEYLTILYPTPAHIRHVDKMRYNLLINRKKAKNVQKNLLITETFKLIPYEKLFTTQKPEEHHILRPLYPVS